MTEQLAYARHEQALKTSCVLFDKKAQCQDAYEHFFFFQILFSLKNRNPYSHAVLRAPQAASPSQVLHYRLPVQSHGHSQSVRWGEGGLLPMCVSRLPG